MRKSIRILSAALVAALGSIVTVAACGDDPAPSPAAGDAGVTTKRIGPAGGSLSAFGVTLEIPAGALASEVEIGIKPVSDVKLPDGVSLLGTAYELSPSGTQFAKPVKLVVPLPAGTTAKDAVLIHQPSGGAGGACGVCDRDWACNGFVDTWQTQSGRCVNTRTTTALRCDGWFDQGTSVKVGTWTGNASKLSLVYPMLGGGTKVVDCYP